MANQEHLDLLKQGTAIWNTWREQHPEIRPDLSRADLDYTDLSRTDLSRAYLVGAKLFMADLSSTTLVGADLTGADLNGANLTGACLKGASLFQAALDGGPSGADLTGADLSEANLTEANLSRANLSRANLSRARLGDTDLSEANLSGATLSEANLSGATLSNATLSEANLSGATLINSNLRGAHLINADLHQADLFGAYLSWADFSDANLSSTILFGAYLREANLSRANLSGADLSRANFFWRDIRAVKEKTGSWPLDEPRPWIKSTSAPSGANLSGADLTKANLSGAKLREANLSWANLSGTNLSRADLTGCFVYATSAWDVQLEETIQANLIITAPTDTEEPSITVDNLEVAQFIYLLLNNKNIRDVINTITTKVVLILGRFTSQRKKVLDALSEELRSKNYLPIIFDFEKPAHRDLTETISTLAHMARFVIADITDAKSIPQELERIVPQLPSVPVQPLLQARAKKYGMFEHFLRYDWVLEVYRYTTIDHLLASLTEQVIEPAEQKAQELEQRYHARTKLP